jgi:hypothetical protein
MAFVFDIKANTTDSHQSTPYWFGVVVPFILKTTYNYDDNNPGSVPLNAISEADLVYLDDDCINWSVSGTKDSHVHNLQLTLIKSNTNYGNVISGGDWIIFWAFNNFDSYDLVKTKVKNLERANFFDTAPKFIGRVSTIIKDKTVNNTGGRNVLYSVTCHGFSELDSNMYFDSLLISLKPDALLFFSQFEGSLKEDTPVGSLVTTQQVIPKLLRLCLGTGPSDLFKTGGSGQKDIVTTPNSAFLVPKTVAKLLLDSSVTSGETVKTVGVTYIDLLQGFFGVQSYSKNNPSRPFEGFLPDINGDISDTIFNTSQPLSGYHALAPLQYDNKTVWDIINQYLLPPVNEMFTCLKSDEDGYVVPTLVCRQIPFSTDKFSDFNVATRFLELPRWNIDKNVVLQIKTGKSDILRQNYVHLMPMNFANNQLVAKELSFIYSLPVTDTEDIKRNGLRGKIGQIGAVINFGDKGSDIEEKAGRYWNRLIADCFFNGNQKYTGNIVCRGIQSPICQGDNVVVDGVIYQIEGIAHSGSIGADGQKEFNTVLQVSNGVSIESDNTQDRLPRFPQDTDDDDDLTTSGEFG